MANQILNWGLLSTARINRALVPPLRVSRRNRLVAVASRSAEHAEAYAREWKIPRSFGSYQAMLDDPDIHVIYNSLPNHLHAEWTIKAAQAGKHVLCEKPIALTVAELDAMAAAANEAGVVVTEAFMYRHHDQALKVKELVQSGVIGDLRLIRGHFTYNIGPADVRLDPAMGGGSIWDIGCYPISYARYIVDAEPLEVFGWQVTGPTGIDDVFAGQMRFPGGVLAQFESSFRSTFRSWLEIVGSHRSIEIPHPYKHEARPTIHLWDGRDIEKITIRGSELYLGEVEDMADAVLLGKPPHISLADSRGNIAAIVALLQSASTNQPVQVT
ncbi:MAG: gfo/Idh/MocA family oxidoreductase [Chloroflexota bacterium]|nr:MAG: gfo/Idh/MocA family oxidoreductase [Chloroflexota bacterium]